MGVKVADLLIFHSLEFWMCLSACPAYTMYWARFLGAFGFVIGLLSDAPHFLAPARSVTLLTLDILKFIYMYYSSFLIIIYFLAGNKIFWPHIFDDPKNSKNLQIYIYHKIWLTTEFRFPASHSPTHFRFTDLMG